MYHKSRRRGQFTQSLGAFTNSLSAKSVTLSLKLRKLYLELAGTLERGEEGLALGHVPGHVINLKSGEKLQIKLLSIIWR